MRKYVPISIINFFYRFWVLLRPKKQRNTKEKIQGQLGKRREVYEDQSLEMQGEKKINYKGSKNT